MSPRRMRSRLLDVAVAGVSLALIVAPFIAVSYAAEAPLSENTVDADVRVAQSGFISLPIDGNFGSARSGRVDGSVAWDLYTSASSGLKLVVSADRTPALRDAANGVDIADAGSSPAPWSVTGSDRRFGFSAIGAFALARFDDGSDWRGFNGTTGLEVARKSGAFATTRTIVKLRGEYGAPLAANARVTTNIIGTAVVNL